MPGEAGEPFQTQPIHRADQSQRPPNKPAERQGIIWTPRQVVNWLRQEKPTEQLPLREPSFDQLLARAKTGVEEFQRTYEAGSSEWKHLLTETITGQRLQAMFLGLRP